MLLIFLAVTPSQLVCAPETCSRRHCKTLWTCTNRKKYFGVHVAREGIRVCCRAINFSCDGCMSRVFCNTGLHLRYRFVSQSLPGNDIHIVPHVASRDCAGCFPTPPQAPSASPPPPSTTMNPATSNPSQLGVGLHLWCCHSKPVLQAVLGCSWKPWNIHGYTHVKPCTWFIHAK